MDINSEFYSSLIISFLEEFLFSMVNTTLRAFCNFTVMYINVSLHIKFNVFNIFLFKITLRFFYIYISTYINFTLGIFHATSQIFMLLLSLQIFM